MERKRVQKSFTKPSKTFQGAQAQTDINNIIKKYKKVYGDSFMDRVHPMVTGNFGDFTRIPDMLEAHQQMMNAHESFMAMPSSLRKRFNNDALSFVEFATDPKNIDELRKLGLAKPAEEPANVE